MQTRVVVIGASAGGIEALDRLVANLPSDLGACVLVTVHIPASAQSSLPRILTRSGLLPATHATDGALLQPNTIQVAPPDRHLLVDGDRIRLSAGPKVNRHRPSIDVMFTAAAHWYGSAVVAIVLSGMLDDGAVGAALVAQAGGQVMVQDPFEAQFASMPRAALAAAPTASAIPIADMASKLFAAVQAMPSAEHIVTADKGDTQVPIMAESGDPLFLAAGETHLTRMVCPDCDGALAQVELPTVEYYRCHVGHQWSPQSLVAAQAESAEKSLWSAAATLEEHAALSRHLAGTASDEDAAAHLQAAERAAALVAQIRAHLDQTSLGQL